MVIEMGVQDRNFGQGKLTESEVHAELQRLESDLERLRDLMASAMKTPAASTVTPARLRKLIKARRTRETVLGNELFADPAWDMLLEAYLAELMQRRLSVTALSRGAAVPPTTALRWIHKLEQENWLSRRDDPVDARRNWIELTPQGSARLALYFKTVDDLLPV